MRDKKTPRSTPGRTPKGFRALFSLWEGKREGRSPLRRGKSANQADVPEVPSSPLRPTGAGPNQASETPRETEPMLQASSPAMLLAARALLSSSLTWSATPQDSGTKRPSTAAPTSQRQHMRETEEVVNHEPVDLSLSDNRARPGIAAATPRMACCSATPHMQTSLPQDLSTPQLLADRTASTTPTAHGLTPPTLSAHNPFPDGTPVMAGTSGEPSASDGGMSSKFSTCEEGSVDQSPAGETEVHRVAHAGHTPAPMVGMSQPPTPASEEAVPPHHPCDADLDGRASISPAVREVSEDFMALSSLGAQKKVTHDNMLDAPACISDAPILCEREDAPLLPSARSETLDHASPMVEPHSRPEVSSPIIESLERSGGSDVLARAGSSGILRSTSSGAAQAAAATATNAVAPARHRHQRSGALDFDSALLLTSTEDENGAPIHTGAAKGTDACVALAVTIGDQTSLEHDVRGSDDSVVLHPTPSAMPPVPTGDLSASSAPTQSIPQSATQHMQFRPEQPMSEKIMSPQPADVAPKDGIASIAPPVDGQEPQHTAPVMAADAPHDVMGILPVTPLAAAHGADRTMDVEMAGTTPSASPLPRDSDTAGTIPTLAAGSDLPVPTSADEVGTTHAAAHRSLELPNEMCQSVAQQLSQTQSIPNSFGQTGYGAVSAEGSPTPETVVPLEVDEMAARSPTPETVVITGAYNTAATSSCPSRTPTAETIVADSPSVPDQELQRSSDTQSIVMVALNNPADVFVPTLPANTPQQSHATVADTSSRHHADHVDDLVSTPVVAGENNLPVSEGMPSQAFALAPDSASLAPTPTAVLLARYHSHLADATAALQSSDNQSSPIASTPAETADTPADLCGQGEAAMANNKSVPLSGGSIPLAMAPGDSADLAVTTLPVKSASKPEEPLPMLSPVQAEEDDMAAEDASVVIRSPDPQEAASVEVVGDENHIAMPGHGDVGLTPSHFQVPTQLSSAPPTESDECCDITTAAKCEHVVHECNTEVAQQMQEGVSDLAASGLTMECSDAVITHDEDSCTRMESPVPSVVAELTANRLVGIAPEATPAGQTPVSDDPTVVPTTEDPCLLSDILSSARLSQEFALRSSLHTSTGVRESLDSLVAPSGTDSILGIASGICGAAVAGALATSTSLPAASEPPAGSGMDCTVDPGVCEPTPPALAAAEETLQVEPVASIATTATGIAGEPSSDAVLDGGALLPTPPDSGRPSLRCSQVGVTAPLVTPRDTALHPITSNTFRVTDSCADRVWRMLQGGNADSDVAAGTDSMTPTVEEMQEEIVGVNLIADCGTGRWDSLTVPEFPSLDEEAYAQLEREALQVPESATQLPASLPSDQQGTRRPSTPPPQLAVPHNSINLLENTGDSPSLQPMICESPGLPAKLGGRRTSSAARKVPSEGIANPAVDRNDDLRQTAITDTLVNQSLSASVMFAGASVAPENETLLESVLDADSAEPETLPSPTHVQPSRATQTPTRRSSGQRRGSLTAPLRKVSAASQANTARRSSIDDAAEFRSPATSTFDAAAIVLNSEKKRSQRRLSGAERPKTAGQRSSAVPSLSASKKRPSTSGGSAPRRASQTPPSLVAPPLAGQRQTSSAAKRLLSHKTIHNITPNHNPNYRPHSPGKTPQAVPPNASPDPKRCRNGAVASVEQSRFDQPLDLARDLQDVDDMRAVAAPQKGGATGRSRGRSAGVRLTPSSARPSGPGSAHRRSGSKGGTPTSAQNLRDSLLTLDPMRLSYGPDGLVSLAGDEEKVLFQADIEAITQALDEYPSQSDLTNENSSAQPPQKPVSPSRGMSPLRVSRVLKQRTPGVSDTAKVVVGECEPGDLQLRLAVALRQAEHFRRENTSLQDRVTSMQEFIEAEKFLTSDQDNTATLLADVSPDARQAEAFALERSSLQTEVATMKVKFEEQSQQMHVLMTKQLPAAHAAVERAEQELAAERARSAMAAEASTAVLAQEKHRVKQAMQEVGKLRTELDRQTVCAAEATQAQRCLEDALSKAQAAAEMAEARYQTKCQELSKTKLAKPSGIGGGIGGPKLKQDLATMTSERDALTAAVRDLQHEVGRVSAALHAKESQYEQLSHSFHQAMTRWEHRGA